MNQQDTIKQLAEAETYHRFGRPCGLYSEGFIAGYTSSLERGLRWVKASERLPKLNFSEYHWRFTYNHRPLFNYFTVEGLKEHILSRQGDRQNELEDIQWLDESAPSDTFSREQLSDLIDEMTRRIRKAWGVNQDSMVALVKEAAEEWFQSRIK